MEALQVKLQKLIANTSYHPVTAVLDKEAVNIETTAQSKSDFLDVHELRLKHSRTQNKVVPGLEELIHNLKNSDVQIVVINSIWNDQYAFGIYTDEAYSKVFGVV